MDEGQWSAARQTLKQMQNIEAHYRDTEALLTRVEAELDRNRTQIAQTSLASPLRNWLWFGGWVGLLLILGLVWLVSNLFPALFAPPTSTPDKGNTSFEITQTVEALLTLAAPSVPLSTPTATPTSTPTHTPTITPTPTPTSLPASLVDAFGVTMRLVPAGTFEMGSENGDRDEQPIHEVFLNDFYIDQYEVTNALYAACVAAGACELPSSSDSWTRSSYYGDARYDTYPVIYVSWEDAKTYCEWREARLPTEAEWEKAARGGLEGMDYPWGNESPTCTPGAENGAQFESCEDDTLEVGSFAPNGYGLYDMAGNTWEWVVDLYDSEYYGSAPDTYPTPSDTDESRVLRGGSWDDSDGFLRVANRFRNSPDFTINGIGFRCAHSP